MKQEGIFRICFIHADEGLAIISSHLWVEAVNKRIEGHKALVGSQKISDVDAIERSGFKGKDNSFKRTSAHQSANAFCNFNCTGVIIRNRKLQELVGMKVHSTYDIRSSTDIDTNKQSRKNI